MKKILIDLTDLEDWHGHHGGTQRVVYGVAKEFFLRDGQEYNVEFIAFSSRDNNFYKTSFDPIFDRVENQNNASNQSAQPLAVSFKSRVKQQLRPYIPAKIRKSKRARIAAKKTVSYGLDIARKSRKIISKPGQSFQSHSSRQKVIFSENDIVLVLGKPWDSPTMERALTNEKAKTGFRLVQMIHDLIIPLYPHLHHPSLFKDFTQFAFETTYNSDLILCNSKSTEKDLKIFADTLNLQLA